MQKVGKLIVFEGIDGSGKTLQSNLLYNAERKDNDKVLLTAEPTSGPIGSFARQELSAGSKIDIRSLQFLFIADRSEHVETVLKPKLAEGYTIITDRYYQSGVVFGSTFGRKLGMSMDYMITVHDIFPKADHIFYIDVPPEVALKRIEKRKGVEERFDKLSSLTELHKQYHRLSERYSDKVWHDINGNQPQEAVHEEIMQVWRRINSEAKG